MSNKAAVNKTAVKHSKKEEQKKLMVRIVCMVLVVALVVTSILAMFPYLFDSHNHAEEYTLEDLVEAGIMYIGEDGNYYMSEEYITEESTDIHEGHDHE